MDNVSRFAEFVREAKDYKINGHAQQARISGGMLDVNGNKYPFTAVTDVGCYEGSYVYAVKTAGNFWVVVGA